MKTLISKTLLKGIGVLVGLSILYSTFFPTMCLAINTSLQDEYCSYSQASTDMVGLLTGDLSYTLPIMEVPSPEGSFPITINYSSGVYPESESGWLGLGWNLNVGSINRFASSLPDDYYDGDIFNHFEDPGFHGDLENYYLYKVNTLWNHNGGLEMKSGMLNLLAFQVGWGDGWSLTAFGITSNFNERNEHQSTETDPIGIAVAVVVTVVSIATGGLAIPLWAVGATAIGMVAVGELYNAYISRGGQTQNTGQWTYVLPKNNAGHNKYSVYLNKDMHERGFGTIYNSSIASESWRFGPGIEVASSTTKAKKFIDGAKRKNVHPVSDYYINTNGDPMFDQTSPLHLAYDNFAVNGPNISGHIAPYRLDQGSVAFSNSIASEIYSFDVVDWVADSTTWPHPHPAGAGHGYTSSSLPAIDYKVPFRYLGDPSNYYIQQNNFEQSNSIPDIYNPDFVIGNSIYWDSDLIYYVGGSGAGYNAKFIMDDETILDGSDLVGKIESRTGSDHGLYDNRLVASRHIEWWTNEELNRNSPDYPKKGIGKIEITDQDGTTYIYSLPVYNLEYESYIGNTGHSKFSYRELQDKYAVHWLLTGLKRSDYKDVTDNGITDDDLGYWVKFDYAKYSDTYEYRYPYTNETLMPNPTGSTTGNNYEKGKREVYYLETIRTRTHTAAFIKDLKTDGKGYFNSTPPSDNFTKPVSVLRLDQIILFTNEAWEDLTVNNTHKLERDGGGNAETGYGDELQKGEKIDEVYDVADISLANSAVAAFIEDNQIQKVVFNQTYDLCDNTLNSFPFDANGKPVRTQHVDSLMGKLTLNSIDNYGFDDKKYMHSYDFEYSVGSKNKSYNDDKWDQWGMYFADGTSSYNSHHYRLSEEAEREEDYWLLKRIITPTGGIVEIDYERDNYSRICERNVDVIFDITAYNEEYNRWTLTPDDEDFDIDLVRVGDQVEICAIFSNCSCVDLSCTDENKPRGVITNVDYLNSKIECTIQMEEDCGSSCTLSGYPRARINIQKDGGNTRVSQISVFDELGQKYSTKYDYDKVGFPGFTSGVVSLEPEWGRDNSYAWYDVFDFPNTGVYYENVTVYNGYVEADGSYSKKYCFGFEMPQSNMVREKAFVDKTEAYDEQTWVEWPKSREKHTKDIKRRTYMHWRTGHNIVEVNTSKIGRLNWIKEYDANGFLVNSSDYRYADGAQKEKFKIEGPKPAFPGVRTEGTFATYLASDPEHTDSPVSEDDIWMRYVVQKTTKTRFPNIMIATSVNKDGFKYSIENSKIDYNTGIILEEKFKNNLGYTYYSTKVPAYKEYPEMGSKAVNPDYKNILSASTRDYTSVQNSNGIGDTIQAMVHTWSDNWGITNNAWRKENVYVWNNMINKDGTYKLSGPYQYVPFNYSTPPAGWELVRKVKKYDDFSWAVEERNETSYHRSIRRDERKQLILATAANAKLCEFTACGAENSEYNDYFDGAFYTTVNEEVERAASASGGFGTIYPHTGKQMFAFEEEDGLWVELSNDDEYEVGKEYVLMFWHHFENYDLESIIPKIYYYEESEPIGDNLVTDENCAVQQFGEWYLHKYRFVIPSGLSGNPNGIKIELVSTNPSTIYIDDIRFQPLDASVESYVYDPSRNQELARLNNDNIGVKYEYFENEDYKLNKIKKVYKETPDYSGQYSGGFKMIIEKDYNIVKY